jgi:hypothetical protein
MLSGKIKLSARSFTLKALVMSWLVFSSSESLAGSISGEDSSATAVCDTRVLMQSTNFANWCTQSLASSVSTGCYAVFHAETNEGKRCNWQGCGNFSLVGRPATTDGVNYIEYGMKTPTNGAGHLKLASPAGGVLPQRPFIRHYMPAGQALRAKRACPANPQNLPADVFDTICNKADAAALNLNPYWWCMNSEM